MTSTKVQIKDTSSLEVLDLILMNDEILIQIVVGNGLIVVTIVRVFISRIEEDSSRIAFLLVPATTTITAMDLQGDHVMEIKVTGKIIVEKLKG